MLGRPCLLVKEMCHWGAMGIFNPGEKLMRTRSFFWKDLTNESMEEKFGVSKIRV